MKLFVMCLTQGACLRRNLVCVCSRAARKNSESPPQQREWGPEHKRLLSHSRALGEVRGPGPRDDCGLSGFPPAWQTCFHKHQECVKKAQCKHLPLFYERQSIIHQSEAAYSEATPPPECGMETQSAALATVSITAA